VNEETDSLRRLVREFSEFARLPAPRPTPGDLSTLLGDLSRLYGERVTYHVRSSPLHARFDEAELRRALINLIDNGLAACREAGRPERVTLSATTNADVAIRAADEGCGIAPENRERIFEPNFSTKSEGMGLGLAIVAEIVRGHGGRIEVESEVGSGTTFTVHLPTAPAPAEEATS
jgi:two-component system nitrogen regulation sensor histidine kinase NtrY